MGSAGNQKIPLEEEHGDSQGRNPRPPPPPAISPPTLTVFNDAIEYVVAVKGRFAGEPGKFEEFLAVLSEYALGSFGIDGVISRMQVLFHGHPDLIRDFNIFLPTGYELREQQGGDADA